MRLHDRLARLRGAAGERLLETRYASSVPMLRIARTASRCTCGSLSSSRSVRSGSASLPPNSRSR